VKAANKVIKISRRRDGQTDGRMRDGRTICPSVFHSPMENGRKDVHAECRQNFLLKKAKLISKFNRLVGNNNYANAELIKDHEKSNRRLRSLSQVL